MKVLRTFLPALLLSAPMVASAQYDRADETEAVLEEVVVEASRARLTVNDIAVNTSVLGTEDVLESAYKPADEILRQIPGFSLLRSADSIASAPTVSTVSLRGLGGNAASRTLVLLDGIPVHSPYSTEIFWARIPRHRIERVEVIRGGGASAWGNLSLGGVINIVTAEPERSPGLSVMAGYPWTLDAAGDGRYDAGAWTLSGYADYYDTDGYYNLPASQRGPVDEPVRKDHWNVRARAGRPLGEKSRLFMEVSGFHETRHGGSALDVNEMDLYSFTGGLESGDRDTGLWTLRLFHEDSELEDSSVRILGDNESETLRAFERRPARLSGAGATWSRALPGGHELTAGADYRWADVTLDEWSRYSDGVPGLLLSTDSEQDIGGVFVQGHWRSSERWQADGTLRYDRVSNSAGSIETDLETGAPPVRQSWARNTETTLNGNLGLRFRATEAVSLRAAAYRGFRAPTLRELYHAASTRGGVILVNNPELAPEQLVGFEGGADLALGDTMTLRLTAFRNTVQDLVQNITRGQTGDQPGVVEPCGALGANETCRELDNVGEMRASGIEVETTLRPVGNWGFQLSYLFNDSEITKAPDNPQLVGKRVRQAPRHALTARARHQGRWFDSSLLARYVGERFEDDLNRLAVDGFLLFDLRFSRRLNDSTELFLAVENLFDEDHEIKVENSGAIETGRPRFVGLGVRWRSGGI
jgi:iron complex outermembrane receptor protein